MLKSIEYVLSASRKFLQSIRRARGVAAYVFRKNDNHQKEIITSTQRNGNPSAT
jgi:hypothetical protein